ncbi:MAG TPA: nuclear transport factor 2 family protein [Thermoleophilaceae bacterium]|jgi:ketosteroid isomerase-like protein
MSAENLELLRQANDRFLATGELDRELLDDDVVIRDHDIPDTRDYHGPADFGRWLEDWGEAWAEWTIEPEEYVDAGDKVVFVFRMTAKGRGSGLEVDRHDAMVYEFRDGKVIAVDYYNSREQGLVAAGVAG